MRIKSGANIQGLDLVMRPVLIKAEEIWKAHGVVTDLDGTEVDLRTEGVTITCGLDDVHSAGSWHYYGRAVDLRTRYFTKAQVTSIVKQLQGELGRVYNVIDEGDHIHVEYDPF